MKKMFLGLLAGALSAALMAGCEWSSGGGADGYNSGYDWVNFSGVYRGAGGVLVSDYSQSGGGSNIPTSENLGTGDSSSRSFSGTLDHVPVVSGSLTITAAGYTLSDNGSGGLDGNVGGASGSISYSSGAWSITLPAAIPGQTISASYTYNGSSNPNPGSSGGPIYSFTVFQQGNTLQITDNNGAVYEGNFGSVSTTSGASSGTVGTVEGQFNASGTSAAGYSVSMAGTFRGVFSDDVLADRTMQGTWIEDGGVTGNIQGYADDITVNISTNN